MAIERIVALAAAVLVAGCTLGPNFKSPEPGYPSIVGGIAPGRRKGGAQ